MSSNDVAMRCRYTLFALLTACAHPASPAPAPLPLPVVTSPPAVAKPAPLASPRTVPSLSGDEQLPEPWRSRFRAWLAVQTSPHYVRIVDNLVISNAVSVVLERRTQQNGVCLTGPSRLELVQDEGAEQPSPELQDFGDDCCPGTSCPPTADGYNLRYLAALTAQNWKELSQLVPEKRKLVWTINSGEQPNVEVTRRDVAAGRFREAPGCGFMYNVPSCDGIDENAGTFTCRCDGGGYHVTFGWEREGNGFVLTRIDEDSH